MKRSSQFLGFLIVIAALGCWMSAEGQTEGRSGHERTVSLDTVLSCADDSLLLEVFKTPYLEAKQDLNGFLMVLTKKKDDAKYQTLQVKGFVTMLVEGRDSLYIIPTDYQGNRIKSPPFCHDTPTANYLKLDNTEPYKQGPYSVDIQGGDGWFLNPNEIFAHADQFQFESGVFTNSSRVFLTAKKGRVTIQFLCKPTGLTFYRANYAPLE